MAHSRDVDDEERQAMTVYQCGHDENGMPVRYYPGMSIAPTQPTKCPVCLMPADGELYGVTILDARCKDDPEANGRAPQKGDRRYTLKFPLENGCELRVHMGREGMDAFRTFLGNEVIDDMEPK